MLPKASFPKAVFILILIKLFAFDLASQDLVNMKDASQAQLIGQQAYYLEDAQTTLSFEQILTPDIQGLFSPIGKDVFIGEASESAVWFKMKIRNETGEDLWLQAGANAGWILDFYRPSSKYNGYEPPVKTGALRPEESKEFPTNFFWLKLASAEDNSSRTYYLKLETGLAKEMPLLVGTLSSLTVNKYDYDLLTGIYLGMILIMVFYNLFLAYATKDSIYLSYTGYIIATGVVISFANGYPLLKGGFWLEYFFVWSTVMQLFIYLFAEQYLRLKKNAPALHKIALFFAIYLSVGIPLLRILDFNNNLLGALYNSGMLLFHFVLMYAGFYLWRKKVKNAVYYVLGWTFLLTSYFIFTFCIFGVIPYNFFTRNVIYFGSAIEVMLFSFALADRLNILKREKEAAQKEIIEAVKKQNLLLEKRVVERTSEIHHRVKNNLQMISSLLNMQERRLKTTSEKNALISAKNRVKSIGLIHEHIYSHDSLTGIDLNLYVTNLVDMLIKTLYEGAKITTHINTASLKVDIDTAIPIGLMLNELITNSIKYAFIGHDSPVLSIDIKENSNTLEISLIDNGASDGEKIESTGFGQTIIKTLLENANGSIEAKKEASGYHVFIGLKEYQLSTSV